MQNVILLMILNQIKFLNFIFYFLSFLQYIWLSAPPIFASHNFETYIITDHKNEEQQKTCIGELIQQQIGKISKKD